MPWIEGHATLMLSAARNWKVAEQLFIASRTGVRIQPVWKIGFVQLRFLAKLDVEWVYHKLEDGEFFFPAENHCSIEAQWEWLLGWQVNPLLAVGVETAPLRNMLLKRGELQTVAQWWDPVTSSQQLGWHYRYRWDGGSLGWQGGVKFRQIRARRHTKLTDNRKTRDRVERWYTEYGIQTTLESQMKLNGGQWRLQLQGNWRANLHAGEQWRCLFKSLLQWRFWKFLGLRLTVQMEYEPRVLKKVQYKVETQLGVLW